MLPAKKQDQLQSDNQSLCGGDGAWGVQMGVNLQRREDGQSSHTHPS